MVASSWSFSLNGLQYKIISRRVRCCFKNLEKLIEKKTKQGENALSKQKNGIETSKSKCKHTAVVSKHYETDNHTILTYFDVFGFEMLFTGKHPVLL